MHASASLIRTDPVPQPNLDGRMPVLDGLRGLAILLVIIVHWNEFELTGNVFFDLGIHAGRVGWIGVDLFFVISGFLITGILMRTKESPNYFTSFYARRVLRIFPLYYTVLVIFLILIPWSGLLSGYPIWKGGTTWWYWAFMSNFGEGIGAARHKFLVITWSLAVEEHFYLIWPMIVWRYSIATLKKICIACFIAPLALRIYLLDFFGGSATLVGFMTPCRIDPIALGALLAIVVREGPTRLAQLRRWSGVFLPLFLAGTVFFGVLQEWQTFDEEGHYLGQTTKVITIGFTCFALLFGTLLVYTLLSDERNQLNRILLSRPFQILGKYSYSIYLIHAPIHFVSVLVCIQYLNLPARVIDWRWIVCYFMSSIATLAVARLSWVVLEKPFLRLKDRFRC